MRFLVFFLISFSLFAAEAPYELKGEYVFTGKTISPLNIRYEPVYAFTEAGRQRLSFLRQEGWSCKVKPRQTFLCSKDNFSHQIPLGINERARTYYESLAVHFEDKAISPSLISEAEALTQYRVHKKVTFNGKVFPSYDYAISHYDGYDIHKVKWGQGIHRMEFVVNSSDKLQKYDSFTDQEKKYYDVFILSGEFR